MSQFHIFDPNGRVFSGVPAVSDRGAHTLVINATDPYGGLISKTVTMTVNGIPTQQIVLPTLITTPVNIAYNQSLPGGLFVDPDGDPIIYTLTEDVQHITPTWLSFNPGSNTLSGIPNSNPHQPTPIRFIVSDGRGGQAFYDVSLSTPNSAPIVAFGISDQSASINQVKTIVISATAFNDPDRDPLTYQLARSDGSNAPDFASIATNTMTFAPRSGAQGAYVLRLIATDPYDAATNVTFSVTVPNRSPILAEVLPSASLVTTGNPFTYSFSGTAFSDPDGDLIQYTGNQPGFLTFDSNGRTFSGTPGTSDRGGHTLTIIAADSFGGLIFKNVTMMVNGIPTQQISLSILTTTPVNTPYHYTLPLNLFVDPDGDSITYALSADVLHVPPSWLLFNAANNTLFGTPNSNNHQPSPILFTVSDGRGGVASYSVSVSIPNSAPTVVNGLANQTIRINQVKTIVIPNGAFNDADNDLLTYQLANFDGSAAPDFSSIATNVITFAPTSGAQGVYVLRLIAHDPFDANVNTTFTLAIPNRSPTLAETLPTASLVTTGNPFTYSFSGTTFSDPDGDSLEYTVDAPYFLSFDSSARALTGTPAGSDRGPHALVINATDRYGGVISKTVVMTVNGIPTQQIMRSTLTTTPVNVTYSQALPDGLFVDPDGDPISYTLTEDVQHSTPSWLSFNGCSYQSAIANKAASYILKSA